MFFSSCVELDRPVAHEPTFLAPADRTVLWAAVAGSRSSCSNSRQVNECRRPELTLAPDDRNGSGR